MPTIREFESAAAMQFRCGFDAVSGEVKGTCVSGEIPEKFSGGKGVQFHLHKVENVEDFLKAIEVKAAVSIQSYYGRGGVKASFVSNLKIHNYSTYIAVRVSVLSGTKILQKPTLTDSAAKLLTTEAGREQFRKRYGDEFLVAITSGGEYLGVLEIQTASQTEYQAVTAKLSASSFTGSISGSAEFKKFLEHIVKSFNYRASVIQMGGAPDAKSPTTPDALIEQAVNFASTVNESNAYDYLATFQTYDVLERPDGPNLIDIQNQKETLEWLGIQRLRIQRLLNSIDFILANPEQFELFNESELQEVHTKATKYLNEIMERASSCFNQTDKCQRIATEFPVAHLPKRLDATTIGATLAAKQTFERLLGHAQQCMKYSEQITSINRKTTCGPDGKTLADQAKAIVVEIDQSIKLAERAADDLTNVADTGDNVIAWKQKSKKIIEQAKEALQVAHSNYTQAYAKGYSPYWHAPTTILLTKIFNSYSPDGQIQNLRTWLCGWGFGRRIDFHAVNSSVHDVAYTLFATDPAGGALDILPFGPPPSREGAGYNLHQDYRPLEGWPYYGDFAEKDSNHNSGVIIESQRRLWIGVSWPGNTKAKELADREFWGAFILKSRKTGLQSVIRIKIICHDKGTGYIDYIDGGTMAVHGSSSKLSNGMPVGWASQPLKQSTDGSYASLTQGLEAQIEINLDSEPTAYHFSQGKLGLRSDSME